MWSRCVGNRALPKCLTTPAPESAVRFTVITTTGESRMSARMHSLLLILLVGVGSVASAHQQEPAPIFDERSVLTPRGTLVIEPSLQYVHSSDTEVAVEGYTVIPTVLIGLINVSQVQRDTLSAVATLRYGLTRRFEV